MNATLISNLKNLSQRERYVYPLPNGNELQVIRLSENLFQFRIEDNYRSYIAPLILGYMTSNENLYFIPFFYWKPILRWGLGGSILFYIFQLIFLRNNLKDADPFIFSITPLMFTIAIQLFLMLIFFIRITRSLYVSELNK